MRRLVGILLALTGCTHPHLAPELIGRWTAAGDQGGLHTWMAKYDFRRDGTFQMDGYPPIHVLGRWTLLDRAPGKLHLKLFHQKMSGPDHHTTAWDDTEGWGELAPDGQTFKFDGKVLRRE